jgi:hypothetical protein
MGEVYSMRAQLPDSNNFLCFCLNSWLIGKGNSLYIDMNVKQFNTFIPFIVIIVPSSDLWHVATNPIIDIPTDFRVGHIVSAPERIMFNAMWSIIYQIVRMKFERGFFLQGNIFFSNAIRLL